MAINTLRQATVRRKVQEEKDCSFPHGFPVHKDKGTQIRNPYERCSVYGAALVAAEVYDSDFCVHGPQGCTSVIKEAFAVQGKEYDYHHSGMTESDIIFGGEKCLIKALTEAFSSYEKAGPKFMVTSCSSEIIGDNVDAVAARVNEGLPLVKVTGGGIKGNQYFGIDQALVGLISKFADAHREKRSRLVNIIGTVGLSRQWRGDLYELRRLLETMGLEVNLVACGSTIDNFKRISMASLTILLIPEVGRAAAEYLQKRFNIPYCYSPLFLPLGLKGTEVWLHEVGKALSVSEERIQEIIDTEEEMVRSALQVGLNQMLYVEKLSRLKGLPVSIIAEGSAAFSWARFVCEELNMKLVFLGLRTGHDNHELHTALEEFKREIPLSPRVLFKPTIDAVRGALRDTGTEFIIGSSSEADMGEEMGITNFLHITNPNTHYVNVNNIPFLGYRGLLHATEAILNIL